MDLSTTYIGEVYAYNNSYADPTTHFSIDVLIRDNSVTKIIQNIVPINNNFKQLPILGENVLIVQGYSDQSNVTGEPGKQKSADVDQKPQRVKQWFYFNPVNIKYNVNKNISFSNSSDALYPTKKDIDFNDADTVNVASMQPFKGDLLIEGRWGNSIRLGSTSKKIANTYAIQPPWTMGGKTTDPIIVLSNSQVSKKKDGNVEFNIENIETDASSIYLTSTQKLPFLNLGDANKKNPLKKYQSESEFSKSQFVGVADRIVLRAKTDIVVIDSPKAIVLNTNGIIKLGNDTASQSMVHGNVLYDILQKILSQLSVPIQCGTMVGTFMTNTQMSAAQRELKNLLNNKYFITKNTY